MYVCMYVWAFMVLLALFVFIIFKIGQARLSDKAQNSLW